MRADAGSSSGGASPLVENADGTAIIPADTEDSFVVGSDRMDRDTADTTKDIRAFFNKVKGAFRAGGATGDQWDDVNMGNYSHAEGYNSVASGFGSHAEGSSTATGTYNHAEGNGSLASGSHSHAEGDQTTASGGNAHAEGRSTTASATATHAEGNRTAASGEYSHAEGSSSKSTAWYSHAEGRESIASRFAQHAKASAHFWFWPGGDAQISNMVFMGEGIDATPNTLTSGNGTVTLTGSGTNVWTLLTNRAHKVRIEVIARRTDVEGEAAGFTWEGVVVRDSGAARIVGAPIEAGWSDAAAAGWTLTVGINETDPANPYLEILGTGEAGKTIRWVAGLYVTEVG